MGLRAFLPSRADKKNEGKKCEINTKRTYNTGDSLVVTDPTTSPAVAGLSMGERTGSRILRHLWSYVDVGCPLCVH